MPTLAELEEEALACTRCMLCKGRTRVVFGVGNPRADLVFVGEGPGEQEDLQGEPFVGRSGKLLDKLVLEEVGDASDHVRFAQRTRSCRRLSDSILYAAATSAFVSQPATLKRAA